MSEHLKYWWTIGMGHGGNLQKLYGKQVASSYKPGLWFVKDSLRDDLATTFPIDMLQGGGPDKSFHEWGQPVSWFRHWIERLTKPGEVVIDPTSGGRSDSGCCSGVWKGAPLGSRSRNGTAELPRSVWSKLGKSWRRRPSGLSTRVERRRLHGWLIDLGSSRYSTSEGWPVVCK